MSRGCWIGSGITALGLLGEKGELSLVVDLRLYEEFSISTRPEYDGPV
jgi:hypothetical protein